MRLSPVLIVVGLSGCELSGEPVLAGNPPPQVGPGTITEVARDAVGPLNARSENHGKVFGSKDGCYVRIPADRPLPPGATGPTMAMDLKPFSTWIRTRPIFGSNYNQTTPSSLIRPTPRATALMRPVAVSDG